MIEYNKKAMDIIRQLSDVSISVKFQKDDDDVFINISNPSETIFYKFRAPKNHFDFKGDECVFYDFPEFYQFLTSFKNPEMDMEDDVEKDTTFIVLREDNAVAKYETADPEINIKTFNTIDYGDVVTELKLSEGDLKNIKRMSNLIASRETNVRLETNEQTQTIRISLVAENNENTYSDVFTAVVTEDVKIEMPILSFNMLPTGDYTINIDEEQLVRFTLETSDEIKLEIFASEGE